jgi:holo-[acyl-carrier protein] synthase
MILGIGTDIVSIKRFKKWEKFSHDQLRKIFSAEELKLDFVRLAARFAAKEAFFKALSAALIKLNLTKNEFSFLFFCKNVEVKNGTWDVPFFVINWQAIEEKIGAKLPKISVELSLSHEKDFAIAFVLMETHET